jgi:hypothetical protein
MRIYGVVAGSTTHPRVYEIPEIFLNQIHSFCCLQFGISSARVQDLERYIVQLDLKVLNDWWFLRLQGMLTNPVRVSRLQL